MTNYLYSLLGNSQKLDGGAMYGNAPRELWSRWNQPDEKNRITLACRALLLELSNRLILIETGIGAYLSPSLKERYGVEESDHVLVDSLKKVGFDPEDITDIVLSHLHFDHAGGLLKTYQEGQLPQLLFTKANFYFSAEAYARAKKPHFRDRASFIPELLPLLEQSGRMNLLSSADPTHPSFKGIMRFRLSEGHTPGLLIPEIMGKEQKIHFPSDLIPAAPWVNLPITMGYDRFPEKLIEEKECLLKKCVSEGDYLFFTHDLEVAMAGVKIDEKGKYTIKSPQKELVKVPISF